MNLEIKLLPWQQQVWNDDTRFKVVAAGRRTGKSRLAAWMLIVEALQTNKGHVWYVAPTQGQARDIMWLTLLELGHPVIESSHVNNGNNVGWVFEAPKTNRAEFIPLIMPSF